MNVHLLFADRDADRTPPAENQWQDRFADLELGRILKAMAGESEEIGQVCRQLLDAPLHTPAEIRYRQEILQDCLAQPGCIRQLYAACETAQQQRNKCWGRLDSPFPSSVYASAADRLEVYVQALSKLCEILKAARPGLHSPGLTAFADLLHQQLPPDYLDGVHQLLDDLQTRDGILVHARLASDLQGTEYVLCRRTEGRHRLKWLLSPSFALAEQDVAGEKDLARRKDASLQGAAQALAQAAADLEDFFFQLKWELSFYVGALNLADALSACGMPVCFPTLTQPGRRTWDGLYDGSLALVQNGPVAASSLTLENKPLCLITGANQGGKTTFLRSVGQCQLMAQCGLFVFADSCAVPVCGQLFTHFKREEDKTMGKGKLEEELARMSGIVDQLHAGDMVLFNESFSSTNEQEGSEIFAQITRALLAHHIEVFSVTHLISYAMDFTKDSFVQYLRAGRLPDGTRTWQMEPGMPAQTAFGEDIYHKIFG